jgi:hypothetical protein
VKKPAVRSIKGALKPIKKVQSNVRYRKGFVPRDMPTYTGMSIAKAYNCPTGLKGSGIAIVEYGGGWNQQDVNQAAQMVGCPVPVITDVNAGGTNSPGGDADDEVALDIQAAMGVMSYMTGQPANIYMIWADSQQAALDAIGSLIDSGKAIGAISVSWGSDEGDGEEQADSASIQAFTAKYGIPFCCATGDNDDGSGSTVDEPADSPYAVGVSGTTKTSTSEYVWNSGSGEGTGGGESQIFPMPTYQQGVIPSPATGKWRTTGDVAAIGDPATGLNTVLNGQVQPIGGTSLATPVFASMIAGMGLGKLAWPDCLYAAKSAFNVVADGNNNPNGEGNWPGPVCCGLGVADGTALYKALTATVSPPPPPGPPPPPPPSPPAPPPPPPGPEQVTLTFTEFPLTGSFRLISGRTETVNVSGTGTVTLVLPPPATPSQPPAQALAVQAGAYRPKSMTWQQWLELITQIIAIINQIVNGGGTPTGAAVAAKISALGGLSPTQWEELIEEILTILLPILLGS